jgi:hypothetical protein
MNFILMEILIHLHVKNIKGLLVFNMVRVEKRNKILIATCLRKKIKLIIAF